MQEKGRISGSELTLLIIGFIFGSSVLLPPGAGAENMGWLAILGGLAEAIVFAFIYIGLALRFRRKSLVEIADEVYGRYLGILVSVAFIAYLFYLGSLVVADFHDFIKISILVQTPSSVINLFGLFIIVYAVANGVEVLSRAGQGMVIVTVLLFVLTTMLLINEIQIDNFLPLFAVPARKILWSAHGAATFPFGEIVAFTMILPFLNRIEETRNSVIKALLGGAAILLLVSFRSIGVLGKSAELFVYPSHHVGRLINIGNVFNRLEILVSLNFLMMGFIKIGVLLYATALGVAQIFRLPSFKSLILPMGLLMATAAMLNFSSVTHNHKFSSEIYPWLAIPFQVGIPLLTLLIAVIRRLPKKGA